MPDIAAGGELLSSRGTKTGKYRLRKLGARRNIIIFHTEGCPYCEAEIAKARELAADDKSVRVFLVNVDMAVKSDQALAEKLFDSFDLSSLPFLMETDRKGRVLRRYFSLSM